MAPAYCQTLEPYLACPSLRRFSLSAFQWSAGYHQMWFSPQIYVPWLGAKTQSHYFFLTSPRSGWNFFIQLGHIVEVLVSASHRPAIVLCPTTFLQYMHTTGTSVVSFSYSSLIFILLAQKTGTKLLRFCLFTLSCLSMLLVPKALYGIDHQNREQRMLAANWMGWTLQILSEYRQPDHSRLWPLISGERFWNVFANSAKFSSEWLFQSPHSSWLDFVKCDGWKCVVCREIPPHHRRLRFGLYLLGRDLTAALCQLCF